MITQELVDTRVRAVVGETVRQRGWHYFQSGRVVSLTRRDRDITGIVQGSRHEPYQVTIRDITHGPGQPIGDVECTCPMGEDCKHVAALMYSFFISHDVALPQPKAAMSWQGWLEAASKVTAPVPTQGATWPPPPGHHLVYVLCETIDTAGASSHFLEIYKITWLKDDRLGPTWRGDSLSLHHGTPGDYRVLQRFAMQQGNLQELQPMVQVSATHRLPINTHDALPVLEAAVSTGKCLLGSLHGQPLRWGPVAEPQLAWRRQSDGSQTLQIDTDHGGRLKSTVPAFYITDGGEVGPLKVAISPQVFELMRVCPPVPLDVVPYFKENLTPELRQLLPIPRDLPVEDAQDAGQPCATFTVVHGEGGPVLRAEMTFSYGGVEVPADFGSGRLPPVFAEGTDKLLRYQRLRAIERQAQRSLERQGFAVLDAADTFWTHLDVVTRQDIYAALDKVLPALQAEGFEARQTTMPLDVVHVNEAFDINISGEEGSPWFDLQMGIEVAGERVDLAGLLVAALKDPAMGLSDEHLRRSPHEEIFLPVNDEKMVAVPKARVQAMLSVLRELFEARPRLGAAHAMDLLDLEADGGCTLRGHAFILALAARLRDCGGVQPVAPPQELRATLRPYQLQGVAWLQFLREFSLGGILADDMGLGKTLQALAHILMEDEAGRLRDPVLIVMPTSLLYNWLEEARRFAPTLSVGIVHGVQRADVMDAMDSFEVVLTTYGILSRHIDAFAKQHFHMVILDESHTIKNNKSQAFAAVCGLQAKHRLCLTGTPMQNNLGDIWSQYRFVMPGLLDDGRSFKKNVRDPIERDQCADTQQRLRTRLKPFLLRRTKAEVVHELPEKSESLQTVTFESAQRDLYEVVRVAMDRRVREEVSKRGLMRSGLVILDALLKLRQVCCDPRLLNLPSARKAYGKSAKLDLLFSMLPQLLADGRSILLYSQFTSMLDIIGNQACDAGMPFVRLDGTLTPKARARAVSAFQGGEVSLMLVSLKAGGVGLNLTAADTVVHYDPWWNPATEDQATDRAHRIGQLRRVMVYKLVVKGSIETTIHELQKKKRQLAAALFGDGPTQGQVFTQEDLDELFAPLPELARRAA